MPPLQLYRTPLIVPEILQIIGRFMTKNSLATSLRLNHYFHHTLEPLLYTELHLVYNQANRPSPAALQSRRLLRHVRHLSSSFYMSTGYLLLDFRNLTTISLQGFIGSGFYDEDEDESAEPEQVGTDREIMDALTILIHKNPRLRSWIFYQPVPQLQHSVWRAIASSTDTTDTRKPRQDLLKVSSATIDRASIPWFLAACQATKKLEVAYCTLQSQRDPETKQLAAPTSQDDGPYHTSQSVKFKDIIGLSVLSQLEFLARCPNVQEIYWQSTTRSSHDSKMYRVLARDTGTSMNQPLPTMDDIQRLVQRGTWMHLRSLVISGLYAPFSGGVLKFLTDEGFAHILEAIPVQQLVSLKCKGTAFGPLGLQALKRHCESVELLVVERSSGFTSALVQEALESFPRMTCLRVECLKFNDIECGGPWMSTNLKELEVQFDIEEGADLQDKQRRHRLVFDRISTLVGLERLCFNVHRAYKLPGLQFCISHGLGALLPLTNVCFLDVSESDQRLEMADVCWMVEKWPKLRTVEGCLHPDHNMDHALREYLHKHNVEGS